MLGLEAIRSAKDLSRNKLANRVQVSRTTIVKLEAGEIEDPSYSLVLALATELEVKPETLFLAPDSVIALESPDASAVMESA